MKVGDSVLGYYSNILGFKSLDKDIPYEQKSARLLKEPKSKTEIDTFINCLKKDYLIGFAEVDLIIPENITNIFLKNIFPTDKVVFLPTLKKFLECGLQISAIYKVYIFTYHTPYKQLMNRINTAEHKNEDVISELTNIFKEMDKLTDKLTNKDKIPSLMIISNTTCFSLKMPPHHIQAIAGYVEIELLNFYQMLTKYIDFDFVNVHNDMIYISFVGKTLKDAIKPDMKGKVDIDIDIGGILSCNGAFRNGFIGQLCFYNSNIVVLKSCTCVNIANRVLIWALGKMMTKSINVTSGFNLKEGDIITKERQLVKSLRLIKITDMLV